MGKSLFAIIVAVTSSILSLIITAIIGTYFVHGEEAIGIGLLWAFSLPMIVILSISSLTLYQKYLRSESATARTTLYVSIILGVTLMSPIVTVAALKIIRI